MNDDGPNSVGLLKLAEVLADHVKLTVIVPDGQRSGAGKALTLDRPIRIKESIESGNYKLITHDGLPADSVIFALSMIDKIDLFVSGINAGANLGYHRALTSGTVGAALEAALQGYPAIAVSMAVDPKYWFTNMKADIDLDQVCSITVEIMKRILRKGLPEGIQALNLNFPEKLTNESRLVVAEPTSVGVKNRIEERTDPYGSSYYWIRGGEIESQLSKDALEVLEKRNIAITPIVIKGVKTKDIESLKQFLKV
jgi:5'-nucleotidase